MVHPAGAPSLLPRVLIVEDSEINRRLAQQLLTMEGCRAEAVANGHEAVKAFKKGCYDLILMDCRLPDVPQFMAARRIRLEETRRKTASRIPIIGITAFAPPGFEKECMRAGMDACYVKPFNGTMARQILNRWLPAVKRRTATC